MPASHCVVPRHSTRPQALREQPRVGVTTSAMMSASVPHPCRTEVMQVVSFPCSLLGQPAGAEHQACTERGSDSPLTGALWRHDPCFQRIRHIADQVLTPLKLRLGQKLVGRRSCVKSVHLKQKRTFPPCWSRSSQENTLPSPSAEDLSLNWCRSAKFRSVIASICHCVLRSCEAALPMNAACSPQVTFFPPETKGGSRRPLPLGRAAFGAIR